MYTEPAESVMPLLPTNTCCCQFAGLVTNIAHAANDSQQADAAPDSTQIPSAPQLQIGDRVLGACRFGSYATHLNVPAQQVWTVISSCYPQPMCVIGIVLVHMQRSRQYAVTCY